MTRAGRAVLGIVVLVGCGQGPETAAVRGSTPAPGKPAAETAGFGERGTPAAVTPTARAANTRGYVGARVCADCHAPEHAGWTRDWHSRGLMAASAATVVGKFDDVHFACSSSEAWMRQEGDRFSVRTGDATGSVADFPVDWLIGGKRMQDPLTVLPDGRWQVLPVYYHVTGGKWVDYTEARQGAIGPGHPFYWTSFRRTANRECLDCHTTGLDVGYDRATGAWSTRFVDAGIACEACHGPGASHAATTDPAAIVHPRKIGPALGLAICAQCHGLRRPLFPVLDAGHHFQPGTAYDASYRVVAVIDTSGLLPDFFADGRPQTSSFEYQALLQSRCHRVGGATCLSCHAAPHQPSAANEILIEPALAGTPWSAGDGTCYRCHPAIFARPSEHSKHTAPEAQSCVACHMPAVVKGVLDRFADHALDVPAPRTTERHDVPNACNECHAAATPQAMTAAIERWWPAARQRQARRERLADAFDVATMAASRAPLEAVLGDLAEAPSLRAAAATLYAVRYRDAAQTGLVGQLSDRAVDVRASAAEALGKIEATAAVPALRALLVDPSLHVRQAAAVALADLDASGAEAELARLAADPATSDLVQPHVLLGHYAMRRGAVAEAIASLERAVAGQPYHTTALVLLADAYARERRWSATRETLMEALRFDPEDGAARARLSRLASNAH